MKTEHNVNLVTPEQERVLAELAAELRCSVNESRTALRTALTEVQATIAELGKRRFGTEAKR